MVGVEVGGRELTEPEIGQLNRSISVKLRTLSYWLKVIVYTPIRYLKGASTCVFYGGVD